MKANVKCMSCILSREKAIQSLPDENLKSAFMHEILGVLYEYGQEQSAPFLVSKINKIRRKYLVEDKDYAALKHKFNQIMLEKEGEIEAIIRGPEDALYSCISYVCAGNYIDFGAMEIVEEELLQTILERAKDEKISKEVYDSFAKDLEQARTLVYLTDNCGEIVLDKLFIKLLKERYENLEITVIVRGKEVINDATMEDAEEVGLTELVTCIGNGSDAPGTVLEELSEEARQHILQADVIISKGQGNFESLAGCGLHPYFLFLCKCDLFVERFGLERFSSVFMKE
ncbi:MAG: DUF89 family protein [Lachnospiraceae bacterium]|nr:DUF89 family protein [Lachnospiraceae bacterium]